MMSSPQAICMAPDTLLARLREGTRTEHAVLERHPLLQPLTSDQLGLQDYLKVLEALLAFYRQIEPQLYGKLPVDCQREGYRYLSRSALLMADMIRLAGDLDIEQLPLLPLPDLSTADRVVGVLYVLEGATQGGRVISPRVIRLLSGCQLPRNKLPQNKLPQDEWALGGSDGVQYLQLFRHGEWQRLQRVIACVSRRSHSADDVVTAAIETFRSLGEYLDYYLTIQRY